MSISVTIKKVNDKLIVRFPYNSNFPPGARNLGGKWNSHEMAWIFDSRNESNVRDLCIRIYGTDGSKNIGDLVDVELDCRDYTDTISLLGRTFAYRKYRDSSVTLSENVTIKKSSFLSRGGSVKSPRIGENNVTLWIRDIPRAFAEKMIHEDDKNVRIIEQGQGVNIEKLLDEKTQLLKRIQEIDKVLINRQINLK